MLSQGTTSPTTNFPSSVTSLNATGTTFGSPFAHVARSHIAFFNTLITDSFNIEYPFLVKINNKKQTNYSVFIENTQRNSSI